jgi:signal transduction histidine kinase
MNKVRDIFGLLKNETFTWIRLLIFVLFFVYEVLLFFVLDQNQWTNHVAMRLAGIAIGFLVSALMLSGFVITANRISKMKKVESDLNSLSTEVIDTQNLLYQIDNETREEVGAWLHGTLFPKIARLAKEVRNSKDLDALTIADKIDELGESDVRSYSHRLYPPALMVSLEVGLETLLENRAKLILDKRLTNEAALGLDMWSNATSTSPANELIRLHIGGERAYAVYRIVEEAVANAERKSNTTNITVEIQIVDETIKISVLDDGEPVRESSRPGLGSSVILAFTQKFGGLVSLENVSGGVLFTASLDYKPETVP